MIEKEWIPFLCNAGGKIMKLIERASYMDFLQRNRERPIIKVVSGVRRCGKSTLFALYHRYLLQDGVKEEQIHVINFEDLAFEELQEYHALYRYVCDRLVPGQWNYVFLDEIQHVSQFEKAVDSLFIKENVDIYLTGSNAYFMSSDLATLLSGRYVELRMLPLSFREFCSRETLREKFSRKELYEKYTKESSFPYAMQLDGQEKDINEYLQGIYSTILLKDVVARMRIADADMLESVTKYLFLHVGSLLSPKKIADSMTSAGRKIDGKTVERYLQGLQDGLLVYRADRFNLVCKDVLRINPKYYVVDAAMRFFLIGRKGQDTGHVLENIVYLELLRRGFHICVGALPSGEVDFVARDENGQIYIQVAESTQQPEVLERELKSLRAIKDNYPKLLLTLDEVGATADYDGIQKKNVLRWLLGEE